MTAKLTLSIDDKVVMSAKKYAKGKGKSLSSLVEHYLKSISTKSSDGEDVPASVAKLRGSLPISKNVDYKRDLSDAFAKKYGK